MTKQELINALKTKFDKVITENEKQSGTEGDLIHYAVPVADITDNTISRKWIHYTVDGNDNAYYKNREPKKEVTPTTTFRDEVKTYIASKIDDGVIESGMIDEIDKDTEKAIVSVLIDDSGLKEVRFLIDKDSNNNIQHRQIA